MVKQTVYSLVYHHSPLRQASQGVKPITFQHTIHA